jgi:hypothetical protein
MNARYYTYLIVSIILAIAIIAGVSYLHYVLLLVKRRCRRVGCGNMKVERPHRVFMKVEDELSTYWYWSKYPNPKLMSMWWLRIFYISLNWVWRKIHHTHIGYVSFRFYIRRVLKLTFVSCPKCGLVELVKIDFDPISIWHVRRIKRIDKQQFTDLYPKLRFAAEHRFDQLRHGKTTDPDSEFSDIPPFSPVDLLDAMVKDATRFMEGPSDGSE